MNKLLGTTFFLVVLFFLHNSAFARSLDCQFKDNALSGVSSVQVYDESVIINDKLEILLEKTKVKCGTFGRQIRLDGVGEGYQVILESCTMEASLKGYLIDSIKEVAAEVECFDF